MGKYVEYYCNNDCRELKKIVDPILHNKFGWLAQKDYDDFYSIASQVVWDCEKRFDAEKVQTKKFKSFLKSCIYNKIKSQLTYMHRDKRVLKDSDDNPIYDTSLNISIGEDENMTIGDTIQSDFDIDKEVFGSDNNQYSEKMIKYLSKLSTLQREVLNCIVSGYSGSEIIEKLNITDKQYSDSLLAIRSYRNTSVLL